MGCIREKKMREASSVSKEETHLVIMAKKRKPWRYAIKNNTGGTKPNCTMRLMLTI
jgi:hypothetical protein